MNLGDSMVDVNIPDAPTNKIEVRKVEEMRESEPEEERHMVAA